MPKEPDSYRLHRAELVEKFGDKQLLTIKDVCNYTQLRDQRTAKKRFNLSSNGITQVDFALRLSRL